MATPTTGAAEEAKSAAASSVDDVSDVDQTFAAFKPKAVQLAIARDVLSEDNPIAILLDAARVQYQVKALQAAFPGDHFLHTFAVKSNPSGKVLDMLGEFGMGFEAASYGELRQAVSTKVGARRIVFDCPVKTKKELRYAVEQQVLLNVDNFQELAIVQAAVATMQAEDPSWTPGPIGVRINPQLGAGSIALTSTATATSKFGIGLQDARAELLKAFETLPFLNMIHLHVGSQGMSVENSAYGVRALLDFAQEVHAIVPGKITTVDIGGGLSVNFKSEAVTPTFAECAAVHRRINPELFTGQYRVLTEFGRAVISKAGFIVSHVEYAKVTGGRHIALQHAGVDLCVRTVYHPDIWPLRITVLDHAGVPRPMHDLVEHDVAGPCCIAGDIIAHRRPLPLIHAGDWLMVHDTGGYYHASFSRYNMRQAPPIWAYNSSTPEGEFVLMQPGESVEDAMHFFRRPQA